MKKKRGLWLGEKTHLKKKKSLPGRQGLIIFFALAGLSSYPDWSSDRVQGQPVEPVQVQPVESMFNNYE
jgi:hypothetical protein